MMSEHQAVITQTVDIPLSWDASMTALEHIITSAAPKDIRWTHVERLTAALETLRGKYTPKQRTR